MPDMAVFRHADPPAPCARTDRRKAAAKAFDYLTDNAYAFAKVPRREIFTLTKEVRVNTTDEL